MRKIDIEALEAADRLARLSDDVLLTVEEASLYLRVSVSLLEKLRRHPDGIGPKFIQTHPPHLPTLNYKVLYRLGDLKTWCQSQKATSAFKRDRNRLIGQ